MRALVTGGCGFIGSHLVSELLRQQWEVTVIDDLSTGRPINLSGIPDNSTLTRYTLSVQETDRHGRPLLDHLVSEVDFVFHLAAVVGVQRVIDHPLRTIETNIEATSLVLKTCAKYNKPVIITSSSEVYGNDEWDNAPRREDMAVNIGPECRWGYAAAKLVDEFTALAHHQESGLPVVIARLFNTVGPNQVGTYGMVVPRMIDRALHGDPIQVYGDGTQRRAFTWVYDVTRALIELVQCTLAYGQVVNIGNAEDIAIKDLAVLVQAAACKASAARNIPRIEYISAAEAYGTTFQDIAHRRPDLTKIQRLIGFSNTLNIEQMIQILVALKTAGKAGVAHV